MPFQVNFGVAGAVDSDAKLQESARMIDAELAQQRKLSQATTKIQISWESASILASTLIL